MLDMSDIYIRLDARIDEKHAQRFLQRMRDLEQEHPDEIHIAVLIRQDDASLRESVELLRALNPELPVERFLARKDMTPKQREAHDTLGQIGKKPS
jgi:hypothetical protein